MRKVLRVFSSLTLALAFLASCQMAVRADPILTVTGTSSGNFTIGTDNFGTTVGGLSFTGLNFQAQLTQIGVPVEITLANFFLDGSIPVHDFGADAERPNLHYVFDILSPNINSGNDPILLTVGVGQSPFSGIVSIGNDSISPYLLDFSTANGNGTFSLTLSPMIVNLVPSPNATAALRGHVILHFFTPNVEPVPEPTTLLLLGTGLAGVAARVRRRRKTV